MSVGYISGYLFANRYNAQAFAHGCDCKGAMGVGVAKGFRERYPDMYREYRQRCKTEPSEFNLGDSFLWRDNDKLWVFNLGTQEHYWRCRASYDAIEKSLEIMWRHTISEESRWIECRKCKIDSFCIAHFSKFMCPNSYLPRFSYTRAYSSQDSLVKTQFILPRMVKNPKAQRTFDDVPHLLKRSICPKKYA